MCEGGLGGRESEDVAARNAQPVEPTEEALAQALVGHVAHRTAEAGDVEGLARRHEGEAVARGGRRDGAVAHMAVPRQREVGMDLIGNDRDMVFFTQCCNPLQLIRTPDGSARIVRVGEYQQFCPLQPLFKILIIDGKPAVTYL